MKWIELTVRTVSEAADLVSQLMCENGTGGAAIYDRADFNEGKREYDWDYADVDALTADYGDGVLVKAYLPEDAALGEKLISIKNGLAKLAQTCPALETAELTTDSINEEDWTEGWKKYYKPFAICPGVVICPSWEEYTAKEGEKVLSLDPGMAFGTGAHETTRMCASALGRYVNADTSVIDVGCGTGILALTAAALGSPKVLAIDLDPDAYTVSCRNIALNGYDGVVEAMCANLLDKTDECAEVVVANIIADVIIFLAPRVGAHIKENGIFIASGIINERADEVEAALLEAGFILLGRNSEGEWTQFEVRKG